MLKDAGLPPFSSDTAISHLVRVQVGFTSDFIWNYTPSEVCFLHLPVCSGEWRWAQQVFLKGVLCQLLWKWSYTFGAITQMDLLSDVTLPLATWLCLPPISPVLSCSSQKGLLNAAMPYQPHNILLFICHYKRGEELKIQCPGGYGKLTLIHDLHPNHPSAFPLVQLVEIAIVPHAPFVFISFLP